MIRLESVTQTERSWMDQVIQDSRATYDPAFKQIETFRKVRTMRMKPRAPRAFQRILGAGVRSPMAWSLVQTAKGSIARDWPKFTRLPRTDKEGPAAARLAASAVPTLQALSRKDLFRLAVDGALADGRVAIKLRRKPLEGYPLRDSGESDANFNRRVDAFLATKPRAPLRASIIDPTNFMPARDDPPSYVVEQGVRPMLPTLNEFGLLWDGSNFRRIPEGQPYSALFQPTGSTTVPVEEIWTAYYCYIRVGGQDYYKTPNDMGGTLPYAWCMGEETSVQTPLMEGVSILYPIVGLEAWMNTLLTCTFAWALLASNPILVTTRDPHPNLPPITETAPADLPLGKHIDAGVGAKLGFVQPPPVGRELIEAIQMLLGFYDRVGMTPLARGIIGTRTPGLTMAAAIEAARNMLDGPIHNLERLMEDLIGAVWITVDKAIAVPVWVTGEGLVRGVLGRKQKKLGQWVIDPRDIDGYYDVHAKIEPTFLQDQVTRGMHAAFMLAHRLWSRFRAMEFSGVEDAWDEWLDVLKDSIREHPLTQEYVLQEVAKGEPALGEMLTALQGQGVSPAEVLAGAQGIYGGAPQPRGQPAPGAGGRAAGAPRRPTGPRQTKQGQQFRG